VRVPTLVVKFTREVTLMNTQKAGRSKRAQAKRLLSPDELFFYDHAGYSYDHKKESPEQGHIRCALALAKAEQIARQLGWSVGWSDDWACGSHTKEFGEDAYPTEPTTCEAAILVDRNDEVLASLGCIDDASAEYRRVVEAELADEALAHLNTMRLSAFAEPL